MTMDIEEAVCELRKPLTPGRKALLYVSVGLGGALCVFFFFAAWLALTG
jgi:hypothetical protein